jgi:acetolactate decarboxylase
VRPQIAQMKKRLQNKEDRIMLRYRSLLLGLVLVCALGCARLRADRDAIYHVSTFRALVEGLFDGEVTMGELKRHGDIGLGAVDGVDGELVIVDGVCYQIKGDGSVHRLDDAARTPYALVTPFEAEIAFGINEETDFDRLKAQLDRGCTNPNLPWAFRIEGTFSYVKVRSVPRQSKPYRRLIEVIKEQREFELKNVTGVIVGFRLPSYIEGLAVPGYHFHFLTTDRTGGGHLLAFRAQRLRVGADLSSAIHVALPRSKEFANTDLSRGSKEEMDTIMGRIKQK